MAKLNVSTQRIDPKIADHRGRVPIWHKATKRWIWRYTIDARELVGAGVCEFEPTDPSAPPRPDPVRSAALGGVAQFADEQDAVDKSS